MCNVSFAEGSCIGLTPSYPFASLQETGSSMDKSFSSSKGRTMEVADEEDISMEEYEIMRKMILQRTISNQSNSLNIFPNGLIDI